MAYYKADGVAVLHGDCMDMLAGLPADSFDAIVTDPPYDLTAGKKGGSGDASVNLDSPYGRSRITTGGGFMGESWDATGIAFTPDVWAAALRVLKPGGHLLAFGAPRTYHRMAVAIEDAGFEIRDSLMWLFGSGFPKSHNISKAIDKAAGAQRERPAFGGTFSDDNGSTYGTVPDANPITDEAARWDGWGTALKPAHEPIVLARKPLAGKTVAANVLAWGVGGLNIDGCRVSSDDGFKKAWDHPVHTNIGAADYVNPDGGGPVIDLSANRPVGGRWPANIILDADAGAMLDAQSGESVSRPNPRNNGEYKSVAKGREHPHVTHGHSDSGGASRFFYCPKANKRERPSVDGVAHPTVKPLALMQYLIRLVTPPNGVVLDPFAGTGTTGEAARNEGVKAVLIERESEYLPLIIQRLTKGA